MTDEQIIQALEDYKNSKILQTENGVISIGDILYLINRQKAEIEEYKTLCDMQDKIMLEQKVILEAINDEFNPLPFETDFDKAIKNAKSEAIKEFAERLKEQFDNLEYRAKMKRKTVSVDYLDSQMSWVLHEVSLNLIDNLVKEMTEPVKVEHNSLCETETYIKE